MRAGAIRWRSPRTATMANERGKSVNRLAELIDGAPGDSESDWLEYYGEEFVDPQRRRRDVDAPRLPGLPWYEDD